MTNLLKQTVAAAAPSAAMEAASHSKNSAMEADTISSRLQSVAEVKHGRSSTSQKSRGYLLINLAKIFFILVLIMLCLQGCQDVSDTITVFGKLFRLLTVLIGFLLLLDINLLKHLLISVFISCGIYAFISITKVIDNETIKDAIFVFSLLIFVITSIVIWFINKFENRNKIKPIF